MRTVLIVEDEPGVAERIAYVFVKKGFKALVATDGRDALDVYFENKPDFVILDLFLPTVDGMIVLARIKADNPDAKVFIMSAEEGEDYQDKAKASGADGYIFKPLDMSKLYELAGSFLELK